MSWSPRMLIRRNGSGGWPHRSRMPAVLFLLLPSILLPPAAGQSNLPSKRGLAFRDSHEADNHLLDSQNSSITWYYTWSANPSPLIRDSLVFLPFLHGLDDASSPSVHHAINALPVSSTHLLTFNEPDGTTSSGGSSISPKDAARSYLANIAPLQHPNTTRIRTWNISHPVVTGSGQGLSWLHDFNASCYDLTPTTGCPADFIAVHWYGDFTGLASWLGSLRAFYNPSNDSAVSQYKFWITEMALPQADVDATLAMMNQSLTWLDEQEDVAGYAWFGAFRSNEANAWTGSKVALFDDDGGLTKLGALYLGGEPKGFMEGMKGSAAASSSAASGYMVVMWVLVMGWCINRIL